jgi:hypothetical protein
VGRRGVGPAAKAHHADVLTRNPSLVTALPRRLEPS